MNVPSTRSGFTLPASSQLPPACTAAAAAAHCAPPARAPLAARSGPKLRFCPESNDLLYPREDKERKKLVRGACGAAQPGRRWLPTAAAPPRALTPTPARPPFCPASCLRQVYFCRSCPYQEDADPADWCVYRNEVHHSSREKTVVLQVRPGPLRQPCFCSLFPRLPWRTSARRRLCCMCAPWDSRLQR